MGNVIETVRSRGSDYWAAYVGGEKKIFTLNFLPWEFLLIKKLEIEKTKTTEYTTFKTDMYNKSGLSFLISNFFTNKNFQGRKLSAV